MVALPFGRARATPGTRQYSIIISITYADEDLADHLQGLCLEALQPTLVAAWTLQGGAMLRVETRDSANSLSLKLEGRFTGGDAENTRTLITRCREGKRLIVELTDVTFIDSVGEDVLSFFGRFGAEFAASTSYALDACERLHLRLAQHG